MLNLKIKRYRAIAFVISLLIHLIVIVVLINYFLNFKPKSISSNPEIIPIENINSPLPIPPPKLEPKQTNLGSKNILNNKTSFKPNIKPKQEPIKKQTVTIKSPSPKVTSKPLPSVTPIQTTTPVNSPTNTPTPTITPSLDPELLSLRNKYEYFSTWDDNKLINLKKQILNNEIPGVKTIDEFVKLTMQLDQNYDWTQVPPQTGTEIVQTPSPLTSPTPKIEWRETKIDENSSRITFEYNNTYFIALWKSGEDIAHITCYIRSDTSNNSTPAPNKIKSFDITFDPDREKFVLAILDKYKKSLEAKNE